ncbi:hypothetical protein, partial [Photobacterium carnosum]
ADVDEALIRVSEITGMAQSKFIVHCLRENLETMHAVCDAVEELKKGNKEKSNDLLCQALGKAIFKANS